MNIQTVAENLRKTIAGKVKHQVELDYALTLATTGERIALVATLEYLKINIDELKRILRDVEQCLPKEHVGDSNFEEWYQTYPRQGISKQVARDAYAAGMGDGQ